MIRYEFVQPDDELQAGGSPMTAALWLDTRDPERSVEIEYEGDAPLVERVRVHILESYGTRGKMNDIKARPYDLIHAIDVSGQLADYEPRRTIDTVNWPDPNDT